ncbi:MAG: flagellar motor switch protein FliM [Pseudomonadota bacterium]
MSDKDVLTQEEIDALLTSVDEGEVDAEVSEAPEKLSEYDLTNQDKVVRGRMPTLELISERFARRLRHGLPNNLKFPIEVGPGGVQVLKYSDYVDMLFVPTCIKLVRIAPFEGTCLLTLDAKLVHRIVDRFFGGAGSVDAFSGKEFTFTEKRVIDRIVELVLHDYQLAWRDVLPITPTVVGEEVNPGLVNVLASSEVMMVSSFRLEMDEGGGELHIAFPYASLEPYRNLLDATTKTDQASSDGVWRAKLERALLDAQLPLSCVIGESRVRLRDLMDFEVGDVIDIDLFEQHDVRVAKIPAFSATLGDSRGKFALEFEQFNQH